MMVTFVSQCEKKALNRTRRVLDAFADRIGDNTWQTVITQEGLLAVKKLLRKTATKNTSVSCHWIRSRSRSELVWVVGNRSKFNSVGVVPTNRTSLDLSHREWEQGWLMNEIIVLAASIAGLFHDFGKANDLFQLKLKGDTELKKEPYRHEWVSLRLFEAFVNGQKDDSWLLKLKELDQADNAVVAEEEVLEQLYIDSVRESKPPLESFAPFAQLVAWLILSHHRLPISHSKSVEPKDMAAWLGIADCHWNSSNAKDMSQYSDKTIELNWCFSTGTPLLSKPWQKRASKLAARALNYPSLKQPQQFLGQRFVAHLSRLSLMLADHYYSSLTIDKSKSAWCDKTYEAFANTDKSSSNGKRALLKQQLDEHNIGVAVNAQRFAQNLPALKTTLPAIAAHKPFSKNSSKTQYRWQNSAYKCAKAIAKSSERQGFFGVNMASTGCGKTIANARIMYALADESEGCRFSVALGLRTLTLQTGDAYRNLLKLGDDELAVLVGSSAVKTLHQLQQQKPVDSITGSESAETLMDELYVSYEGQIYDGRLKHWLEPNPKLEKLISAPVLVSTIDHLMPATESQRGGKQIAPMLRLLSADLVLDEPDDFGLEDLPALCRLVNWAGMLGSRVLLSSATLPPALISSLFEAYAEGRQHFNEANFPSPSLKPINCAWFDEFKSESVEIAAADGKSAKQVYLNHHKGFIEKRVAKLKGQRQVLRKGKIIQVDLPVSHNISDVYQSVVATLHKSIHKLHDLHSVQGLNGRKVSVGVIRLANINPLIEIAKLLVEMPPDSDYSFHFCVYHSQFPLALRSYKEMCLDETLNRHDPQAIFAQENIAAALKATKTKNNVFIVLGTSVVEVGRDHDYDWALAEPSSLRALIQLAGRVQRHRQCEPPFENIWVLNKNIRALRGDQVAYCKPGFESKAVPLSGHDMTGLVSGQLDNISAISRVYEPSLSKSDFDKDNSKAVIAAKPVADFWVQEHRALRFCLNALAGDEYYRSGNEASLWWHEQATWSGEFIKQTEFRKSQPQEAFILRKVEDEDLRWSQFTDNGECIDIDQSRFTREALTLGNGCHWWLNKSTENIYEYFSDKTEWSVSRVSERFGEINLRAPKKDEVLVWCWHEQLGAYQQTIKQEVTWKN